LTRYSDGKKKKELKWTRKRRGRGMGGKQKKYDREYKLQAVKLSKEIGGAKAAAELGIPVDTLYGWQRAVREGRLKEEKEFLEEASAFFAASRRKSAKSRG